MVIFSLLFDFMILILVISIQMRKSKTVFTSYVLFYNWYFMFVNINFHPFQIAFQSVDLTTSYNTVNRFVFDENKINITSYLGPKTIKMNETTTVNGEERVLSYYLGNDISIPEISFVLLDKNTNYKGRSSKYAFAYDIPDKNHSITHQLKTNGLIDHLSFSLLKDLEENGTIFFGSIPNKVIVGFDEASCPINGNRGYWECYLSHVFIGNMSYVNVKETFYYINSYSSHFTTDHFEIRAPKTVYEIIIKRIFYEALLDDKCKIGEYNSAEVIQCDCKEVDSFDSITFVFNGFAFAFESREIFKELDNICYYMITSNIKNNNWVIGHLFFKYIPSFDYELKSVVFYSNSTIGKVKLNALDFNSKKVKRLLCITSSVVMLCMMIFLTIIKSKK